MGIFVKQCNAKIAPVTEKGRYRTISHASYIAHTKSLFRNLKILNVFDFSDYNLAIFMYLCYNGFIPTSISDKFSLNTDVHTHNTRGSSNFHLPKIRTCVSQNSVFFKGPKIWNGLPSCLKNIKCSKVFKMRLKLFLLER